MPKESQPRKNAYATYFPLLFAFKFKVKFDGVKKKKLPQASIFLLIDLREFFFRFWVGGRGGGGKKKN